MCLSSRDGETESASSTALGADVIAFWHLILRKCQVR